MERNKTIKSIANDLHNVYDEVRSGKLDRKVANSLSGVASVIVSAAKVRLKYKEQKDILKVEELED